MEKFTNDTFSMWWKVDPKISDRLQEFNMKTLKDVTKQVENDDAKFSGGAKRSSKLTARYDLVPPVAIKRIAERFGLGAEKFSDFNYHKSFDDPEFVRDIYNHIQEHLGNFLNTHTRHITLDDEYTDFVIYDDDLAAAAWGLCVLMELEQKFPSAIPTIFRSQAFDEIP